MEHDTINCIEYEENVPKVSYFEENGILHVLGSAEDMPSPQNDKKSMPEDSDELDNSVQHSSGHEAYVERMGVQCSTKTTELTSVMSSTHTHITQQHELDSATELAEDSFQSCDNSVQALACDTAHGEKSDVRDKESPTLINVSTPQNSAQSSGLFTEKKDALNLLSSSPPAVNPACVLFPVTDLHNTTCTSQIEGKIPNEKFTVVTEKEDGNFEKNLFSIILLQGVTREMKMKQEDYKKACEKHVTFSSYSTKVIEQILETSSSRNKGDELVTQNTNTDIQNNNVVNGLTGRFARGVLSVMARVFSFACQTFSSAISETWESTAIVYEDKCAKCDGPKPRPALQSHVNRMYLKRKFLPLYVDETESKMKRVKRS
jgi:hypothetical protein